MTFTSEKSAVLPRNENGFHFADILSSQRPNFKRGIPKSRGASTRIQSYANFGKDIYMKRPASNANGCYHKLGMK